MGEVAGEACLGGKAGSVKGHGGCMASISGCERKEMQ